MIKATGLWLKKNKNGKSFMIGNLGAVTVMIFKNENKVGNQPDYEMVLAESKQQERTDKPKAAPVQNVAPKSNNDDEFSF